MKALKNESVCYTDKITAAITECCQRNAEPTDAELMELYGFIGRCICEQGEKAFVVHLAQFLSEQLPQLKGFSPRNLRRMRDFYRTYENSPLLLKQAQTLNWTQNAVILECCETNEQRAFYIRLAVDQNLSKLALMKAIDDDAISATTAEIASQDVQTVAAPVCDDTAAEGVDTTADDKPPCGAFVPACEPPRQGGGGRLDNIRKNQPFNWLVKYIGSPITAQKKRHIGVSGLPTPRWRPQRIIPVQSLCFA